MLHCMHGVGYEYHYTNACLQMAHTVLAIWLAAKSCYDEWKGRKVSIGDEGKEGQREKERENE